MCKDWGQPLLEGAHDGGAREGAGEGGGGDADAFADQGVALRAVAPLDRFEPPVAPAAFVTELVSQQVGPAKYPGEVKGCIGNYHLSTEPDGGWDQCGSGSVEPTGHIPPPWGHPDDIPVYTRSDAMRPDHPRTGPHLVGFL